MWKANSNGVEGRELYSNMIPEHSNLFGANHACIIRWAYLVVLQHPQFVSKKITSFPNHDDTYIHTLVIEITNLNGKECI